MSNDPEQGLIGIVVPTYYIDSAFAERALRSAEMQVGVRKEILVVGLDSTIARLSATFESDEFKWLRTTNSLPISEARNHAIKHSSAEWFTWLDADDELADNCLHAMWERSRGRDFIIGRTSVVDSAGSTLRPSPREVLEHRDAGTGRPDDPLLAWVFAIQPQLIKRSVIEALAGFQSEYCYGEMTDLFLRYVSRFRFNGLGWADDAIYKYYRTRADSHSTNRSMLSAYRCRALSEYGGRQSGDDYSVRALGWVREEQMQRFVAIPHGRKHEHVQSH